MARVTVQAIADQLGLSKFAVSRALSGHPGVSEATRASVVELAERLGYVPRARSVARRTVEIIYHDPDVMHRELWTEIQAGAQIEGTQRNVSTAVRWTDDPQVIGQLARSADAFLLLGPHEDAILTAVRNSGRPGVRIGGPLPPLDTMDQVSGADEEGAAAVALHLLELGHRRFAFVHGKAGFPGRAVRLESFAARLDEVPGTQLREIPLSDDNAPGEFGQALKQLHRQGFRPTAFFCGNDYVAVTVLTELMRMGCRVPQDASVVGYADYVVTQHTSPALTTVRVPYRQMGAVAINLLLARLGSTGVMHGLPPQRIDLVPTLIARGSSGPAPSPDE
jgi:Transcriptional regulators